MPKDVVVNFRVGGIADVQRGLRTVQQASARAAAAEKRDSERNEREKTRIVEREAKEKIAAYKRNDRLIEQAGREAVREFDKQEREKNRSAEKWLRDRERQQRASNQRTLAHQREFARAIAGAAIRGAGAGIRRVGGAAMGMVNSVLAVGGGFDISSSVQRATANERLAANISNSGLQTSTSASAENRKRHSTSEIQGLGQGIAIKYGMESNDVLTGLQKYTKLTGDLSGGMQMLPKLAEFANATGTSFEDVAASAGSVSKALGALDPDGKKTMMVLRGLAGEGKLDSIEMSDFAKQIPKITAAAGRFGGELDENMLKMGAIAQEARGQGGASGASVAANAASRFSTTFKDPARAATFESKGIHVFTDESKKYIRDPEQLIVDALRSTKGNQIEMGKLFKGIMPGTAVGGYVKRYNEAGGGSAGEKAVLDRIHELTKGGMMSEKDVSDANKNVMDTNAAKMAQVMAEFDKAVADDLVPDLIKLIPEIKKLIPMFIDLNKKAIPAFVDLIKAIADFATANKGIISDIAAHPIGALIAFELAKSIGSAAIGAGVRSVILRAITESSAFSGAKGVAGAAARGGALVGTLGAVAGVLAVGAGSYSATGDAVGSRNDTSSEAFGTMSDFARFSTKLRSGKATPEEISVMQARAAGMRQMITNAQHFTPENGGLAGSNMSGGILATLEKIAGYTGVTDSQKYQNANKNNARQSELASLAPGLSKSLADFQAALDKAAATMGKADPTHRSRSGEPEAIRGGAK